MADQAPFYSGAGPRRDKTLADAEAAALGKPPPSPTPVPPAPAPQPEDQGLLGKAKKLLGFADGGPVESCHNPANRLPGHAFHGKR